MKSAYMKPAMMAVKLQQKQMLCSTSVNSVSSNLSGNDAIDYQGGSSSGTARVKEHNVWDEEW